MSKPVFEDLFAFSGRRNRKSFAIAVLLVQVLSLVVIGAVFGLSEASMYDFERVLVTAFVFLLPLIFVNLVLLAQRFRDIGQSGWLVFLTFLPYVGSVIPFVMMVVPGEKGPNKYGPDPLQGDTDVGEDAVDWDRDFENKEDSGPVLKQ